MCADEDVQCKFIIPPSVSKCNNNTDRGKRLLKKTIVRVIIRKNGFSGDFMDKVRVALVGISGYGRLYLDRLLDKADSRIEIVGFVEPYPESCLRLAEIKERGIPVFSSCEEMYSFVGVDLTVIVSPIAYHTKQIITALENGSNVLCEKPLCAEESDIELIARAQSTSGKFVYVGYQWSYSDAINRLKKDIISGKYGKCISCKSLVLWPRDIKYFTRSCGWAGKIRLDNGYAVYDSVLNNATAHYLHNLLFLLGEESSSLVPSTVDCTLLRANDIENFDTAKLDMAFESGTKATVLASHAINRSFEPSFMMHFEKGDVYYSARKDECSLSVMPGFYTEYGKICGYSSDGEKTLYGDPFADGFKKLYSAVEAALNGYTGEGVCGIKASSAHTRVINRIQSSFPIYSIEPSLIRTENMLVYADGLFEKMIGIFKNGEGTLEQFKEKKDER